MPSSRTRPDQAALLWASLATVALWALPFVGWVALPLEYLNTHAHELFHALAAVLTGGRAQAIIVHADGSGVTPVIGGNLGLVASAGYVGAALLGALLILYARRAAEARTALRALSVVLGISTVLWVRGDAVGLVSGLAWIVALWTLAARLPDRGVLIAAAFLGIQQCLHSVQALLALTQLSVFTKAHTDAMLMQEATGVPAVVWAIVWSAFSLALIAVTLKGVMRRTA